jgi:mannosyltransferase
MLVAAITAVGLVLRLPSFGDSLFGDELSTYYIVTGHSVGHVIYLLQGHSVDLNPPLFFVLSWLVERFGDGAQTLRLVSLLAGTAAIPLTYTLGLWTVGRRAGLVGAALVALSPFLIFYSTEARAYALSLLLVLVCTLCLLRALDTRRWHWWAGYSVCSCAAMYTHYIVVFFLGTLFVWAFLTQPDARRALLAANLAAAIAYIPWLPTLLKDTRSPGNLVISFLEPFSAHLVGSFVARWSIGHPLLPLATLPGCAAIAIIAVGLAAALLGLALRARPANGERVLPRLSAGTALVVVLAFAPPAEIALYSSIGHSVWEARNLIAAWPGLALTVGALLTSSRGLLCVAAIALVIVGYAIGAAKMLEPSTQRPDYNSAVSFIDRVGASGDPVIDVPGPTPGPLTELDAAFAALGRSQRGRHPVLRLGFPSRSALERARPYAAVPPTAPAAVIRQAVDLARGGTLFLVALRQETPFLPVLLKPLPARFRRLETTTFAGLLPVLVYVFRES